MIQRRRQPPSAPWSQDYWQALDGHIVRHVLQSGSPFEATRVVGRHARAVLRAYSTSFFIVTRFLPACKRDQVEAIYAAVRFPDEIVDTFPISPAEKARQLAAWGHLYEQALDGAGLQAMVRNGLPPFLALFASVVQACGIPPEYYRAFLSAMRTDAQPRRFATLDDLIEGYIYGSAVVVGYFLAHVYGPSQPSEWSRAMRSARDLAIALQLTNFMRDVGEDQRRGRLYLPEDLLREEGILVADVNDPAQHAGLARVLRRLSHVAAERYGAAAANLDAFAADSRTAIRACIDVYRQLNDRIGRSPHGVLHREQVPFTQKVRVLPTSKYWKLPLAYLTQ